jgi:hypothetical protein
MMRGGFTNFSERKLIDCLNRIGFISVFTMPPSSPRHALPWHRTASCWQATRIGLSIVSAVALISLRCGADVRTVSRSLPSVFGVTRCRRRSGGDGRSGLCGKKRSSARTRRSGIDHSEGRRGALSFAAMRFLCFHVSTRRRSHAFISGGV